MKRWLPWLALAGCARPPVTEVPSEPPVVVAKQALAVAPAPAPEIPYAHSALPVAPHTVAAVVNGTIAQLAVPSDGGYAVTLDSAGGVLLCPSFDGKREPVVVATRIGAKVATVRDEDAIAIAVVGKRGEVDKGTDRYANIEVSYLLQRMEAYRGLAILTTSQRDAIDTAFVRRLRFIINFPFPDVPERLGMWQRAFPAVAPNRGIDVHKLATLKLPGGNIRSIALNAAYLAAATGEPISIQHVIRASRAEFVKIERPFPEADVAGW